MEEQKKVICQIRGWTAVVTIDNPPANAIDRTVIEQLSSCFDQLYQNEEIRAVILTGTGKFFAAGADIKEFQEWTPTLARELTKRGQAVFTKIEQYPAPVIAAINGFALGGGLELALACDIRYAAVSAKMGLPEVSLGIIPGYGGTQRLFRTIGPGKARELIYTADKISAEEAMTCGLVQKIVATDCLRQAAEDLAKRIGKNGPIAVKQAKLCMNSGQNTSLEKGLSCEADSAGVCFASKDKIEGVDAFLQKRATVFKNQ